VLFGLLSAQDHPQRGFFTGTALLFLQPAEESSI
jgi:hypothetical protein